MLLHDFCMNTFIIWQTDTSFLKRVFSCIQCGNKAYQIQLEQRHNFSLCTVTFLLKETDSKLDSYYKTNSFWSPSWREETMLSFKLVFAKICNSANYSDIQLEHMSLKQLDANFIRITQRSNIYLRIWKMNKSFNSKRKLQVVMI